MSMHRPRRRITRLLLVLAVVMVVAGAAHLGHHAMTREYDRAIAGPFRLYNADTWTVVTCGGFVVIQPNVVSVDVIGTHIVGIVDDPGETNVDLWERLPGYFVIEVSSKRVIGRQLTREQAALLVGIPAPELKLWRATTWAILP